MKFIIKDSPISYDEIYQSVSNYIRQNHGKRPAYMLVNPETRRNILISSVDVELGRIPIVNQFVNYTEEGIRSVTKVLDIYLLQSEDVEPGFMILCG